MVHEEVVPHPNVMDEGDELAKRFIFGASAREAMTTLEPGIFCFFY